MVSTAAPPAGSLRGVARLRRAAARARRGLFVLLRGGRRLRGCRRSAVARLMVSRNRGAAVAIARAGKKPPDRAKAPFAPWPVWPRRPLAPEGVSQSPTAPALPIAIARGGTKPPPRPMAHGIAAQWLRKPS